MALQLLFVTISFNKIYHGESLIYDLLRARSGPEMGPVLACMLDVCGNGWHMRFLITTNRDKQI